MITEIAIINAPQMACEMCNVLFPICGYPVMMRNTRFPNTDATAHTRNTSRFRRTSTDRNANFLCLATQAVCHRPARSRSTPRDAPAIRSERSGVADQV